MADTIAATEGGENATTGGTEIRLGRVERAILAALPPDGGFVPRDTVVRSAFPEAKPQAAMSAHDDAVAEPLSEPRALAEAAVSRAIGSLQRKGLVVRDRNRDTGRTLLRSSAAADQPAWELVARAEEDFSAHAAAIAQQWRALSNRARERAGRVRVDRSPDGTEDERRVDMELPAPRDAHVAAVRLRDWSAVSSTASTRTSMRSTPGWQLWRSLRRR